MFKNHQGVWLARECLARSVALLEAGADLDDPATLDQIRTLADEASDHALDIAEPERTRIMTRITDIRGMIRTLAEEE